MVQVPYQAFRTTGWSTSGHLVFSRCLNHIFATTADVALVLSAPVLLVKLRTGCDGVYLVFVLYHGAVLKLILL
jgi:hypothetical protein